jgi:thioredoxin 1
MSKPVLVTDATFEVEIEKHDGLVVLDQLAGDYAGKVKVAKLDVDSNIQTATRFNVRSIPMLLFFKGGKVVDTIVGAVPRPTIESKFQQHAA